MIQVRIFNDEKNEVIFDGKLQSLIMAGVTTPNENNECRDIKLSYSHCTVERVIYTIFNVEDVINELYDDDKRLKQGVEFLKVMLDSKLANFIEDLANED